jgi:hypothetical protein|tara:strand:- start:7475 stop:7855 length:381 start_codon:yes stop_codon:yes gene_type:complete
MEAGADTPIKVYSGNANSGIPAWRDGKVGRILGKAEVKTVYFPDKRNTMKPNLRACGQAMVTALVNAVLAVALMLLVEFAISGTFQVPEPYLWAGLVIWLVIFAGQFWRQRHLCKHGEHGNNLPQN